MKPKESEQLAAQIEAMMPKSLDDIVRLNRDKAIVRLALPEEIMALEKPIDPGRTPNQMMNDWRIIALVRFPDQDGPGGTDLMLLGSVRAGIAKITSDLVEIDLDNGLVITQSGSLYKLGKKGEGEPPFQHLAMVCAAFHSWGFGSFLGAPRFFF